MVVNYFLCKHTVRDYRSWRGANVIEENSRAGKGHAHMEECILGATRTETSVAIDFSEGIEVSKFIPVTSQVFSNST
jgi:hypothetical protein